MGLFNIFSRNKGEPSLYECFRTQGRVAEENESYKTVKLSYNGQNYTVYSVKKPVKKSTIIHCQADGTIYREQLYAFGKEPSSIRTSVIKPVRYEGEVVIVLFSGKPNFRGIDEGVFVSAQNKTVSAQSIYVMTKAAFKQFKISRQAK